ncbi:aldose epimerase family protein [Yeosuana sp. MJ-SS3]|uniref:Aldose 1-epimerase n=2 Tax=Gilvirhabdus luticola TaxID=3079858 RepID=A0ABU3U7F3_9FLAO|nr:aldose epimerase family protein [Yeosuana sp. MJ-SS3]MDU8886337.1 aldose epimerase family protein [Yeosuana sp. MJ-SS3]
MEVEVITYGGIITSLKVPDKVGQIEDVVLGYDTLQQYIQSNPFFGALIGRYGNRIAKGKFSLNSTEYTLAINNGNNHLHGGNKGFDKVLWSAQALEADNALKLTYISNDTEEGYPGTLSTTVTYTLTDNNELKVLYEATTDKPTIVNLTQHSYFNLSGDMSKPITDHELLIDADSYLPVDKSLIPTGEFRSVENTPFDFRIAKPIGQDISANIQQLKIGKGYDHNWVLNYQDKGIRFAASAYHPSSGRLLEVFTTEPGMQFYSGNILDAAYFGKNGVTYKDRTGFCLETQHYPDSPNQEEFPSVVLNPGEQYRSNTVFKFSTM